MKREFRKGEEMSVSGRISAVALAAFLGSVADAKAGSVSPDVIYNIFSTPNANGSFTIATVSGGADGLSSELGLRARLRYDETGEPQNVFNWDGTDTYTFAPTAGTPAEFSVFNFEWSITTPDSDLRTMLDLGYRWQIAYDTDPSPATSFSTYDPLKFDAFFGYLDDGTTPPTANAAGTYVPPEDDFGTNEVPDDVDPPYTVAQNSVNMGFLFGAPVGTGTVDIRLSLFGPDVTGNEIEIGATQIRVETVPLPAPAVLLLAGIGALGIARRRARG